MKFLVVFLFDYFGVMVQLWVEVGYDCLIVDIQYEGFGVYECYVGIIYVYQVDLICFYQLLEQFFDWCVIFVVVFLFCDYVVVFGVCWFKGKGLKVLVWFIQCFVVVVDFVEEYDCLYCLENFVFIIFIYWCKLDYSFYLYDYVGLEVVDYYIKKICFWIGGGFVMFEVVLLDILDQLDNCIYVCVLGFECKNICSCIFVGFVWVVFIVNVLVWGMIV